MPSIQTAVSTTPFLEEDDRTLVDQHTLPALVLIVEDDSFMRTLLAQVLEEEGYEVRVAPDGEEALKIVAREPTIDLIVTDYRMPRCTGLELLEAVRRKRWDMEVLIITAFADEEIEREALRLGARSVFPKPFELSALLQAIRELSPVRW